MASTLYKAQFDHEICEKHDKNEFISYCKTCDEKICSSCIKEDHDQHDWESITDILREKKGSLSEECRIQLPGLKRELSRFDTKIKDEDARFEQNKSTINCTRQSYINGMNRLFDEKIDKCRQKSKEAKQIHKEKRDALKQKIDKLEMLSTSLDNDINILPDHDIMDMEKEMREELEKALSYSADKYTCTTVFVPGKMDVHVHTLENIIGEIHNMSVEEIYDIDRQSKFIFSLNPVSETNAWVKIYQDRYPKLIDKSGELLRTIESPCLNLVLTNAGEFVLASKTKYTISVLKGNEDIITTIDTKPLRPNWVSKTVNDDILVSLMDDGDDYKLRRTSRRIVQRMSLTGKVSHTYEFMGDGKTRLFTLPTRIAENKNTDICIVNWLSDVRGELVVLHENGRVKFTYSGDIQKMEKFMPSDVECDSKCHILFTEKYSKAIHILSAEGMYLCILCQYEHIRTYTFSIYGESLWCGFKEGRMKVLKYKN